MLPINVTVCQLPNHPDELDRAWAALLEHVREKSSRLVLLPEMPFYRWPMAERDFSIDAWDAAVAAHEAWLPSLEEFAPAVVAGTRPIRFTREDQEKRFNEAFLWVPREGYRAVHRKVYLPNEEGFWEASWYQPGPPQFSLVEAAGLRLGFLICTEQWFFEHARDYGERGADVILSPRATLAPSTEKWVAGGRSAATVSGAYHLASNLAGPSDLTHADGRAIPWGGSGWIIEPEEGEILGRTSNKEPFLTLEIEPEQAAGAKGTYPRYVHSGSRTNP